MATEKKKKAKKSVALAKVSPPKKNVTKKPTKSEKKSHKVPQKSAKSVKKPPDKTSEVDVDTQDDHDLTAHLIKSIETENERLCIQTRTGWTKRNQTGRAEDVIAKVPKPLRRRGGQLGNNNAKKWTEEIAVALAYDLLDWLSQEARKSRPNLFFEEFLVKNKGLNASLISSLSVKYESFGQLIGRAKEIQRMQLYKWGTWGELNACLTKFALANHHGDTDKVEQTIRNPDGSAMANQINVHLIKPETKKEEPDPKPVKKKPKGNKK